MPIEVIHQAPQREAKPLPFLFIHGAWHGAWCFEETFMSYVAERGYHAYALSLRGHGNSSGNAKWANHNDYLADIREVVDSISPHPILLGHSMGGYLLQKYMERYASEIPAAILLASIPIRGVVPAYTRLAMRDPLAIVQTLVTMNNLALLNNNQRVVNTLFSPEMPIEAVEAHRAKLVPESFMITLSAGLTALPKGQHYDFPLLVLGGSKDALFTPEEIRKTAAAYHTEAEFFPIAHDMMTDIGWEAVAERIVVWADRL